MPRAMWKGVVRIGEDAVPVKLYAAIQDTTVRFRRLHAEDRVPVSQRMVNPITGREVPSEDVRKGYEAEEGEFVILDDEDLEATAPPPSRDIEVIRFVDPARIGDQWYDRPYHLGPDGDPEAYTALARALERRGRAAIVRWTMRKKEYLGALRSSGSRLGVTTLRHADEIIPASELPAPAGRAPDRRELAMAEQLVEALRSDFDPAAYRDQYRDRVMELIRTKARGGVIRLERYRREPEPRRLEHALAESLKRVEREKRRAA